jgi:hypothetical protein
VSAELTAHDREGAAVEAHGNLPLEVILAAHEIRTCHPAVGTSAKTYRWVCDCGEIGYELGFHFAAHRAHVAAVIAAGWVPQSEVTEREAQAWDAGATAISQGRPGESWRSNPFRAGGGR